MAAPFTLIGIDHVVLRAADPAALERFYMEVLGCAFEKRQGKLAQLRAGHALIDIVPADEAGPAQGRSSSGGANLDHLCLRIAPFDASAIVAHLAAHGVSCGEEASRYGAEGQRLSRLARGIDVRAVDPVRERKSVSAENTFETDIASFRPLEKRLWAAAEEVADRLKEKHLCGSTVTLKLKTSDFRILTRARSLESPTQLAGKIFGAARDLLEREINGTRYRLLGVGVSGLADAEDADPADLIDQSGERRAAAERAMDRVRDKFGHEAMVKGLALKEQDDVALTPKTTKTLSD